LLWVITDAIDNRMAFEANEGTEAVMCLDGATLAMLVLVAVGRDNGAIVGAAVLAGMVPRLAQECRAAPVSH
jgi:hypothetical protein